MFRTASLLYAVLLYSQRYDEYEHPIGGWAVLAGMATWTAYVWWRPGRPARLQVADLAAACAAVLSTALLDTPERIAAGAQTLPVTWPASSVLAFAVWKGWWGGLLAAAFVGLADLVVVGFDPTAGTAHNIVLLLLLGGIVGYSADLYRKSRETLAQALRLEAATRERERLARDIHDSVLQVLAFVQRRGAEIGGEAAHLGRLAGEQEEALRHLVSTRLAEPSADGADRGSVDLRPLLGAHQRPGVQVSAPADPVPLPHAVAAELAAAVGAALANVAQHAGPSARAWVLIEDEGDDVVVSVRDDGVGMTDGRLDEACRDGRLGFEQSIRGRVTDVGGAVSVVSGPGAGTEVEMRVPRRVRA